MQVYGASTSPLVTGIGVGAGASKYTDLVNQYTKTLANGSTASLDDKLSAWTNLTSLIFARDNNAPLLMETNKNDYKRAVDTYQNSDFAKQIQQVDGQFNNVSSALAGSQVGTDINAASNNLNLLSRFSQDQQKMIFVAMNMNISGSNIIGGQDIYYSNLDDWKADLKQQSSAFNTQEQASAATASSAAEATASLTAALSSTAARGLTTASTAMNTTMLASQSGTTSLKANSASVTYAGIAVQLLLKAQEAMQKSPIDTQGKKTGASGDSAYTALQTTVTFQSDASEAVIASLSSRLTRTV